MGTRPVGLYYDVDGSGAGAAVQITTLTNKLTLAVSSHATISQVRF